MKKFLSVLLTVGMTLSVFTGCGGGSSDSNKSDNASTQTEAPAKAPTPEPAPAVADNTPVTVKWAMWDYNSTAYYKAVKNAYALVKPNVTLEFIDLGSADYNANLTTQLAGGETYDVISVKDTPGYLALIDGKYIEDLKPYIAKSDVPHATAYDAPYTTADGKLYQLAWRADPWVLFYNMNMFDAVGVAYPKTGITFSQYDALVKEVGDKLKALSADDPYAGKQATFYHGWRSTIQLYACTETGDAKKLFSGGDYSYLKPYYEKILGQMNNGYAMSWPEASAIGARYDNNFVSQDFAMTIMGTWLVTNILSKPGYGDFKWGMVSYPVADGVSSRVAPTTTAGIAVTTSSKNKDAAYAFASWLAGPQGAATLAATGAFTAYVDANVNDLLFSAKGFPTDETSMKAIAPESTFLEAPVMDNTSPISQALDLGNNAIMKEGTPIDEGLKMMQEAVDQALAQ